MGITHLSIYKGYATQILAQSTTPSDREEAMYDSETTIEDGDWYFDTDTNTMLIRNGGGWSMIDFTIKV